MDARRMQSTLGWGFVGLGRIAHAFARDLALFDDARLVAVGSRSGSNARSFADEHGAEEAFDSYEAVWSHPDVDIVYVATPHSSHAALSIAALEAGKHVLCEKPVAVNAAQTGAVIDAARANGRFFMEALWSRFNPVISEVLDRTRKGDIGTVRYIQADFSFPVAEVDGSRTHDPEQGGGSLLDMGIYPLFLAYALLGVPSDVVARMIAHPSGVDQQMGMVLQYDQAVATLYSGFASQSTMRAVISGEEGRIVIDTLWHEPDSYAVLANGAWEGTRIHLPKTGHGLAHEIEACHACVRSGLLECPEWTHADSLQLMQTMDRVRASAGLTYPFEH
jgi:predicted dehydrogenase